MRSAADGAPSFVHLPGLGLATGEIAIAGEEAHYLRRVVRIRPGEAVTASDGEGTLAELLVIEAGEEIRAEIRSPRRVERATTLEIWCGAPEGDRADWLVEKLAELGVAALRLVDTERGRWERAAQRAARWDRLAIAALRQSRSAHRLRIVPPMRLAEAIAAGPQAGPGYLADPGGVALERRPVGAGAAARAAIGPSGGFSADEIKLLEASGFVPTRLTPSRLRTETAALAMAALLLAGDSGAPGA